MKKTLICSVPMKNKSTIKKTKLSGEDCSLKVSDREVRYAISALLDKNINKDDEIKVILLVKKDGQKAYQENLQDCIEEISAGNNVGAKLDFVTIETDFSQEKNVHEEVLAKLIEETVIDSQIIADITYGPKDLPILIFTALNFAEKFLKCEIKNIIYTQANFVGGEIVKTTLCDMAPLYYLNSLTNTITGDNPQKAKEVFKSLLSF